MISLNKEDRNVTYIIIAAGKGTNLQPLTLKYPKTSFKLDENVTVLQRMVRSIRSVDKAAEIVVVVGYMANNVKKELDGENVKFVMNPFYEVTNSISSLWFARDYLERENVTIVHGDVVYSDEIVIDYLTRSTEYPYVLVDSTVNIPGAYNVVAKNDRVLVMSKKLENYSAKYSCMTKLDPVSSRLLKQEIDVMINGNMYDQYFEDSLVQMILFHDFQLSAVDVAGKRWTEVDCVDDLLNAQTIQQNSDY